MSSAMELVFLDTKTVGAVPNLRLLDEFGDVSYFETTLPEHTPSRIRSANIVITNKVILDEDVIEQAEALRLICIAATGTNNVDEAAARKRGISIRNVVDYSSNSVAQGTFAMLLHLVNHLPYFDRYVKGGCYSRSDIFTHVDKPFWELSGKIFGIIGLGNIGRKVAAIATAFGSHVVYHSTSGRNKHPNYTRLSLDELLSVSDIVAIHAPLNQQTANLIGYDSLRKMKRSALLINVGRGGIVNEADLARAIDDELIAGAGIDVFEKEPIDADNPLLHVKHSDRLVLTPHAIWASIEARTLLMDRIGMNIREFLKENRN